MAADETLERLGRVRDIASRAGLSGEIDRDRMCFQMLFGLPGDRTQAVFVRDASVEDRAAVTFFSVCLVLTKGLVSGLSKETAVELLEANEKLQFARYGIWEFDKEITVVASYDCLLDTLDPAECHNAAWAVAFAADQFEHRHGHDDY